MMRPHTPSTSPPPSSAVTSPRAARAGIRCRVARFLAFALGLTSALGCSATAEDAETAAAFTSECTIKAGTSLGALKAEDDNFGPYAMSVGLDTPKSTTVHVKTIYRTAHGNVETTSDFALDRAGKLGQWSIATKVVDVTDNPGVWDGPFAEASRLGAREGVLISLLGYLPSNAHARLTKLRASGCNGAQVTN